MKKLLVGLLILKSFCVQAINKDYVEPSPETFRTIVTISHEAKGVWNHVVEYHKCTASIISQDTIVTAAHCLGDDVYVKLKENNNYDKPEKFKIIEYKIHPRYYQYSPYDIAIAKVDRKFPYWVKFARLSKAKPLIGEFQFAGAGWNPKGYEGHIQVINVSMKSVFSKKIKINSPFPICKGDSGGPIYRIDDDGNIVIFGVASYSKKDKQLDSALCSRKMSFASSKHASNLIIN